MKLDKEVKDEMEKVIRNGMMKGMIGVVLLFYLLRVIEYKILGGW